MVLFLDQPCSLFILSGWLLRQPLQGCKAALYPHLDPALPKFSRSSSVKPTERTTLLFARLRYVSACECYLILCYRTHSMH